MGFAGALGLGTVGVVEEDGGAPGEKAGEEPFVVDAVAEVFYCVEGAHCGLEPFVCCGDRRAECRWGILSRGLRVHCRLYGRRGSI